MRAFLSHSSTDKDFIRNVADVMRPGTYELDELTFDAGLVNSEAIRIALSRCDLFVLFLSKTSVRSHYVDFETLLGIELLARGALVQFVAICLDDDAFSQASENVKFFNIVRKCAEPEVAARIIQGILVSAHYRATAFSHPFLGRDDELQDLERQFSDPQRPPSKFLFVSGNPGTGRRTLSQNFFERYFRHVRKIFLEIPVSEFDGPIELHRTIFSHIRPTIGLKQLKSQLDSFNLAKAAEQHRQTAQLINSLLLNSETAFLVDEGGILTDDGDFNPPLKEVLAQLNNHPHPPVVIISPRMMPHKFRSGYRHGTFLAVRALKWEPTKRIISALLKRHQIQVDQPVLEELASLTEGHPFNIYNAIELVRESGASTLLADPANFIEWKHRQSSEFLRKIDLSQVDCVILQILKNIPELDLASISSALAIDPADVASSLHTLSLRHVIDSVSDRFRISPAVKVAVERDPRILMPSGRQKAAIASIARSLSLRLEDGTAPIALVDAAILSSVESGAALTSVAAAFLLPSHYVWLSKKCYDQRQWHESVRHGQEALKGLNRLSNHGLNSACRFICLAAARIGDDKSFSDAIILLESRASSDWTRSNVAYLKGFRLRIRGRIPAAKLNFERAYELANGNLSAIRELAALFLAEGDFISAEKFAREAYDHARTNPYFVDILLSVLLRMSTTPARSLEISELFDALEIVGETDGHSFFSTRKAEHEFRKGSKARAADLIAEAVKKTPRIFEVRRLEAEINLDLGNKTKAASAVQAMEQIVNDRDIYDRRSNYPIFLKTKAHYLAETGQHDAAMALLKEDDYFSRDEQEKLLGEIKILKDLARTHGKR